MIAPWAAQTGGPMTRGAGHATMIGGPGAGQRATDGRQHPDESADGNIDVAGDDHHRHANGRDRDIGVAEQNVGEIARSHEARIDEADNNREDDNRDRKQKLLAGQAAKHAAAGVCRTCDCGRGHAAFSALDVPPIIAAPTASEVASARSNSATILPSCITSTRSLMPNTSGSSLEIMRMATPSAASWLMSRWISAFAPTSMPRVGSSRIKSLGLLASHLPSTIFC